MQGIQEGKTRSGLYYDGYRILKAKRPQYSIIENVKNLTSKRFKPQFESILEDISNLGYINYWQVLNAKNYGIPQNRERVFIISIRNDIAKSEFCFPPKVKLMWKLKDFLEENVDSKYYLSEKGIDRLITKNNKLIKDMQNPAISSCIIAGYSKIDSQRCQFIGENNNIQRVAGIYDNNKVHQAGSIYNPNGLSPTLTNMSSGGSKQPFVLVNEGTKIGYSIAKEGDSINISYPQSTTKRGRVGREVSQTILTSPNIATLENINKPICINNTGEKLSIQDRIYDANGIYTSIIASNFRPNIAEKKFFNPYNNKEIRDIAPTQTTNCGSTTSSSTVLISNDGTSYMKIRKLTPLECWRLMRI